MMSGYQLKGIMMETDVLGYAGKKKWMNIRKTRRTRKRM